MIEPHIVRTPAGYQFDWLRRNRLVDELALRAPHADTLIIKLVAGLLAGSACSDALLIAADAIEDAARTLAQRDDWPAERRSLQVLVDVLREAAPGRAVNELLAGL